jgi:uncharacterized protein (TIGR03435 family)
MMILRFATGVVLASCVSVLFAQSASPAERPAAMALSGPLVADVHKAPFRPKIVYTTNISRERFDMRNATILDMIQFAYNLGDQDDDREVATIVGGPTWIDFDRFDVSAVIASLKAGPASPGDNSDELPRAAIKRVLAERFGLKMHTEDRPLPGYLITAAKGSHKLAEAKDPTADAACHGDRDKADPMQYTLTCTSITMARFVPTLAEDFPQPIMDRTGLTKAYDFAVSVELGPQVHTRDDLARIYTEAFAKQLGLVITREDVPQPAYVVDSVDRTPTGNVPDIAKLIPALPDLEFEVASIRLASDDEPHDQIRAGGSQIAFTGFNLQGLITRAWQLPTGMMLGDALAKLPPTRFTILVKLPPGIDGRDFYRDQDQVDGMLQKLLIDRFGVKYHWGEWTQPDAYVLLAGSPKMKKADPNARTFCKFGPPEGEKTYRTANSPFNREFHCQNVTMAQFADLAEALVGSEVKNRVPDKTGLAGSYDFWVYFTGGQMLRAQATAAAEEAKRNGDATSAPIGGLPVQDAFRKELGLRLEKQPLTLPALILDQFEKIPTDN